MGFVRDEEREGRTSETPNVSHLAKDRGKAGKSTARMPRMVMSIMCDLYVVNAGSGGTINLIGAFSLCCDVESEYD